MIRFIPDYYIGIAGSDKDSVTKIAEQMTKDSAHMYCENHPNFENVVSIYLRLPIMKFKIIETCCPDYRKKLEEHFGEAVL